MRVVFVGAGVLTVMTAQLLLGRGHEVVIIEQDKECIDSLTDELDCGFLHGDGAKPATLHGANPKGSDFLFCLTGHDQTNIIASLVGRSLGFKRVITKIEDQELQHICIELGLNDTIIPSRTIGRYLADIVEGQDIRELALMIKGDARLFSFAAGDGDHKTIAELELPSHARVICLYRGDELLLPDDETVVKRGDEVVVITRRGNLPALQERWGQPNGRRLAD